VGSEKLPSTKVTKVHSITVPSKAKQTVMHLFDSTCETRVRNF